jgi:hypothetical protein
VVYRLGFSSVPLAGMPDHIRVGGVDIYRAIGPVATQQTLLRQRHGLPVVFDKAMDLGVDVAANEVLTICQITDVPPKDPGAAFIGWREEAHGALGMLAAVLDDRVAIEERFEDLIQIRADVPASSADSRSRVRTFLPFDVTEEELRAMDDLGRLRLGEVPERAEAARWYLRGARQGPTADAVVCLWIAIEALTPARSTSPKIVEVMLIAAGFDPAWLGGVTVGTLAGLRADIVHKGIREDPRIRDGFYRLEAIARVLIRQSAGITSSWPPALVVGSFGEAAAEVARQLSAYETIWHEDGLPAPDDPKPAGLTWDRVQLKMVSEEPPMKVTVVGELQPGYERRVRHWLASAARFLAIPLDPLTVQIEKVHEIPDHVELAVNRERMVIRPEVFVLPDPQREMRLAWLIQGALAKVTVMRLGIDSVGMGAALIELAGSWAGWRAVYAPGQPLEERDLKFSDFEPDDLLEVGGLTGAALAGSPGATRELAKWAARDAADPSLPALFERILEEWTDLNSFAELLTSIAELAQLH